MKALIYLELRQLINSIKNTARSPKRLIPTLIMGAWIVSWFLNSILFVTSDRRPGMPSISVVNISDVLEPAIFLVLCMGIVATVYSAFASGLMVFSISQIDFLFPAPINRRLVLIWKLGKDYAKLAFWVTFFFLFIGSPVFSSLNVSVWPWGLLGIAALMALIIGVFNLAHTINLVFTYSYNRLGQAATYVKIAIVAVLASPLIWGIYQYALTGDTFASALLAADSPVVNAVFAPARWTSMLVLAPVFGVMWQDWVHFGLLWLLATGSFLLLLSRKENIYEPSLAVSVKYARRRMAMKTGDYVSVRLEKMRERGTKQVGGLAIPAFGQGAVAIFWKNLLTRYRVSRTQIILMFLLPIGMVLAFRYAISEDGILTYMPLLLIYLVWVIPMIAQTELRAELGCANFLKSMPIAPWKVMFAQAMSIVTYLVAGVILFAVAIALFVPEASKELLLACCIAAPFLGFSAITAMQIPSLLYPDTKDSAQNYLCGIVGTIFVTFAFFPSVVLAIFLLTFGEFSVMVTSAAVCLGNALMGAAGVALAGIIFRRFDPTSE